MKSESYPGMKHTSNFQIIRICPKVLGIYIYSIFIQLDIRGDNSFIIFGLRNKSLLNFEKEWERDFISFFFF